jgi:hypothetical protein
METRESKNETQLIIFQIESVCRLVNNMNLFVLRGMIIINTKHEGASIFCIQGPFLDILKYFTKK